MLLQGQGTSHPFIAFGFPSFVIVDYVSNAKPGHEVMNCKKFCPTVCITIVTSLFILRFWLHLILFVTN
jgi:hypothetical protein